MPELMDIMNEVPQDLVDGAAATDEDQDTDTDEEDTGPDDAGSDDQSTDDTDDTDEEDESGDDQDEDTEEDDEYEASTDDERPEDKPATPQPAATDERTYILNGLSKMQVRVVMPTADGKGKEVRTVEAYGNGDLPREMLGFATKYEEMQWFDRVNAQERKALELQSEYRTNQMKTQNETFVTRENRMIADDLTELRQEGIFPKFKGVPGSKEFDESAGAKEFDRVVAFMNEQNDKYIKAANAGRAYRHIGFREAFMMLHGSNVKAADKRDMQGRRQAAGKLKTGVTTKSGARNVKTTRVNNLTDLDSEFADFVGGRS